MTSYSATIQRLADCLDVEMTEVLDSYDTLANTSWRHNGYKYKWTLGNEGLTITFRYQNKNIEIHTGLQLNMPKEQRYAPCIAGWFIDDYIKQAEFKRLTQKYYKGHKHGA